MKGLELAESFFFEEVKPLIDGEFHQLINGYAGGLIGYGSDVLGNDDDISRDHEWGPRCHIWLTREDYQRYAKALERMLQEKLPMTFHGYKTRFTYSEEYQALVTTDDREDSMHHVAITHVDRHLAIQFGIKDRKEIGALDGLCIPEQKLMELTRGKIFYDPIGDISDVRKRFAYYTDDIWVFKMQYCWNALSGFPLVPLCIKRGEPISAHIIWSRIMESIIRLVFLLNRRYYPGYMKWFSHEFAKLPRLSREIGPLLEQSRIEDEPNALMNTMDRIVGLILEEHHRMEITPKVELTPHPASRGFMKHSLTPVIDALSQRLPDELRRLAIGGSCDQWITNDQILVWSELYTGLKDFYGTAMRERDGVGDLII